MSYVKNKRPCMFDFFFNIIYLKKEVGEVYRKINLAYFHLIAVSEQGSPQAGPFKPTPDLLTDSTALLITSPFTTVLPKN
jgi:hypothetical protein